MKIPESEQLPFALWLYHESRFEYLLPCKPPCREPRLSGHLPFRHFVHTASSSRIREGLPEHQSTRTTCALIMERSESLPHIPRQQLVLLATETCERLQ